MSNKEKAKKEVQEDPKLTIEKAPEVEKASKKKADKEPEVAAESESMEEPVRTEPPTLQEVIREQAIEDEAPMSKTFTLRKILGGDILTTQTMRHQVWLFLLITFFVIVYISNRYSCQQDQIEIDRLQKELKDAKYRSLASSSQLTEKTRESRVLELLQSNKDSVLKIPQQPPYVIHVPSKNQ
ncbi:MAG: hypothetical protein K6C10_04450 [Prevotella sp.]|nr:hypothetical protein [Prevotella sp.]